MTPVACSRDERPHHHADGEHACREVVRRAAEGVRAFRPRQEMVDLVLPRAAGEDAVRLELQAPVVLGGELADRGLAFERSRRGPRLQQPRRERRRARVGSRRDRATGRARRDRRDPGRARTDDLSDRCRRERRRRAARASRGRRRASARTFDEAQRVVPGHALVDARMPATRMPKTTNSTTAMTSGSGVAPRRQVQTQDGRGGEERRQPQPRDERSSGAPLARFRGVTDGVLRVRHRFARITRPARCPPALCRQGSDASSRA